MATTTIGELLLQMRTGGDRQTLTALQRVRRYVNDTNTAVRNYGNTSKNTSNISSAFNAVLGKMAIAFTALNVIGKVTDMFGYFIDKLKEGYERGINYNSELEYTNAAISALVGSQKVANEMTEKMIKLAAETPFATKDYAQATKTLLGYGVAQEDILPTMKMLGNISMGDATAFNRLALAFGQVTAKGKLQAEEVRQMVNQGFNPLKFIAEETGISMTKLQGKMRAGEITADMVNKAFIRATTGTGRFAHTMEALSNTYKGQKEKIQEYGDIFLGKVTKPMYDIMASNVFPRMLDLIKFLTGNIETFYSAMGKVVVKVKDFVKAFVSGDLSKATTLLQKLIPKVLEDRFVHLAVIVRKFRTALVLMKDAGVKAFDYLKEKTGISIQYLKDAFMSRAIPAIKDFIKVLSEVDPKPFIDAFNKLKDLFKIIEPQLKTVVKFFIDFFVDKIVSAINNTSTFSDNIGSIISTVVTLATKMKTFWDGVLQVVLDGLKSFDGKKVSEAWDKLKQSLATLKPFLKVIGVLVGVLCGALESLRVGVLKGIIAGLDEFIAIVLNVVTVVTSAISFLFNGLVAIFTGDTKLLADSWKSLWTSILDLVVNLGTGIWDIVVGFITGIIDWWKNLYHTLVGGSIVPDLVNGVINWFKKLPGALLNVASSIYTNVKNKFSNLKNTVVTTVSGLYTSVKGKFNSIRSTVSNAGSNIYNTVKSKFNSAKSTVSSAFSGMYNTIKSKISSARNIVNSKISSIKTLFSGLTSKIKSATNINLYSAGKNLLDTFINGIKSKISNLSSTLSGAANKIKSYLGFSSPTKEGAGKFADKWMPNLFNMLAEGINEGKKKLAYAMQYTSSALVPQVPSIATGTTGGTTNNNTPITLNVYADSLTNGRTVGQQLVKELNSLGILTHKG